MAGNLNSPYHNNINVVTIRNFGTTSKVYTDRRIDIDGDGDKEQVTITHVSGHAGSGGGKVRTTVTVPVGAARTIVDETIETDGGFNSDINDEVWFTESVG